jgi:hypothetical protein
MRTSLLAAGISRALRSSCQPVCSGREAYRRYRQGELSDDELPDLSDIFPDDPKVRARIGLQTVPALSVISRTDNRLVSQH